MVNGQQDIMIIKNVGTKIKMPTNVNQLNATIKTQYVYLKRKYGALYSNYYEDHPTQFNTVYNLRVC